MDNLDFDIVESLKEVEQRCNTFLNAVNDCGSNVLVGSSSWVPPFLRTADFHTPLDAQTTPTTPPSLCRGLHSNT